MESDIDLSSPIKGEGLVVLAATGLKREAALIAGKGLGSVVSGGVADALANRLRDALTRKKVAGIISVGLGGALSPELAVGDWVVAERVTDGSTTWEADAAWTAAIAAALGAVMRLGAIVGSDAIVASAQAKADLRRATDALVVDMESHVAARIASAHGLPFAALRVISDAADGSLPKAAVAGMRPDGGMDLWGVLGALVKAPRQLPALIRTGREADVAFKKLALLGGDHLLCGPGIGCPYLGELLLDVT
jgi:hopanoid-associated phosphorylase